MSRRRPASMKSRGTVGSGPPGIAPLADVVVAVGAVRVITGVTAWLVVRGQLSAERIVVPDGRGPFAGRKVAGPLSAFAEAEAIKRIALKATEGRTYGELPEGDPMAETAMDAALLRGSLFTSILAFAMAAAEVATGVILVAVGSALGRLAGRGDAASS